MPHDTAGLTSILPPDDRTLSPHTGYTRAHWLAVADRMLQAAIARSDIGGSRVDFSTDRSAGEADRLEGFARTFLLAALRIAAEPDARPDLVEHYIAAFDAAARTPWPPLTDHSQPTVEAAAIAIGLHVSRERLWERLSASTRSAILAWFEQARGEWCADNNHVLLGATLAAFRASVGHGDGDAAVDAALDRMENWYLGDGWYTDGDGRRVDYYNAWAFHFYPFFIARMVGSRLDARRELYRERLGTFIDGFQHLVGANGSPVLQGRSLIYRWGIAAPFWMAHLEGVDALSPGRSRRLCSGMLRYFVDAGAVQKGTLELGWLAEPHAPLVQSYSGPGSPYWTSKGFLGLLLPEDDPIWTAREEHLAIEHGDVRRVLAGPRWVIDGRHDDGIVRVHNFGSDGHPLRDDGLYRRLVHSSGTAPLLGDEVRDNTVTVVGARQRCLERSTATPDGGSLVRVLDAGGRQVVVDCGLTLHEGDEYRVARLSGVIALPLEVSGYAMSSTSREALVGTVDDAAAAVVDTVAGLCSTVEWLGAWSVDDGTRVALEPTPHVFHSGAGTALGPEAAVPAIGTAASMSNDVLIAWRTRLGLAGAGPALTERDEPARLLIGDGGVSLQIATHSLRFTWSRADAFPADRRGQGVFRAGRVSGSEHTR